MDKSNNFFNFITLYQAYQRCRKNKRRTQHALKFEERMEKELCQLEKELQAKNYHLSKSICFVVTEPTTREVFAASFRDRVVHHLLCGFLEPIFETKFDQNSFACRKDKGTHKAVKTLQKFLRLTGAENGKILSETITNLEQMRIHLRLASDLKILGLKNFELLAKKLENISQQLISWHTWAKEHNAKNK